MECQPGHDRTFFQREFGVVVFANLPKVLIHIWGIFQCNILSLHLLVVVTQMSCQGS